MVISSDTSEIIPIGWIISPATIYVTLSGFLNSKTLSVAEAQVEGEIYSLITQYPSGYVGNLENALKVVDPKFSLYTSFHIRWLAASVHHLRGRGKLPKLPQEKWGKNGSGFYTPSIFFPINR
jgi:hypothetical protein